MGKIFLRRLSNENCFIPYSVESNKEDYISESELGDIVVLLPTDEGQFVFGLGAKGDYAVHIALGVVDSEKDLTSKVYEGSIKYGKELAATLPEKFEFVDETGGPRKIEIIALGG